MQEAFTALHQITESKIYHLAQQIQSGGASAPHPSDCGKHKRRPNQISPEQIQSVVDHIKVIFKRGTKYIERIMNQSKSSTSVMYASAADGTVLPPYIAYRATHMYDTWTEGGPPGTRYNRSKSGWFDMTCFSDWFMNIILPYANKITANKVVIGDNVMRRGHTGL